MYKFFCFEIEVKIKADSYMPCEAMAHSTKFHLGPMISSHVPQEAIVGQMSGIQAHRIVCTSVMALILSRSYMNFSRLYKMQSCLNSNFSCKSIKGNLLHKRHEM